MNTKKEAAVLAHDEPQAMETTTSISTDPEAVNPQNDLRALRLGRETPIPVQDMVEVVRTIYPRYDKHLQSKAERTSLYGIRLMEDAMTALVKAFAPEQAPQPKATANENRTNPCRLVCRVSVEDYNLLKDCMTAEGFSTTQDWLYSHLKKYLKAKGAYK